MAAAEKGTPWPEKAFGRARGGARFVGRRDVLTILSGAVADVQDGRGRVVCLGGEAGIGKTRLAEEVAEMARSAALGVHYAWGYEGVGSPPFWLWTQVLRSLVDGRDLEQVRDGLVDHGEVLRAVLPELGGDGVVEASRSSDARFRLFDAVAQFVLSESRDRAQVVILDDAHWADPSSLRMLEFFAREVPRAPILVVVGSRDPESEGNAVLADTLGSLARHDWVERLDLGGLEAPDVDALVRDVSAAPPSPRVVEFVHERTRGNPFFVKEMVRFLGGGQEDAILAADPSAPLVPTSIRGLVARRLESLPDSCHSLLRTAVIVGQEPEAAVVAHVMGRAPEEVLAELEPAEQAQLVVVGADRALRFTHPLIRDALVLESSPSVRSELHLRAGQVLEERAPAAWAEIATHFSQAPRPNAGRKAIEYGQRAAEAAMERFAFEDAVRLYGQAHRVLATMGEEAELPPERRAELLLGSAAAHSAAGDLAQARQEAVAAAAAARQLRSGTLLARAALQFSIGQLVVGTRIGDVSDLFEEALTLLEPDAPLRVRLLAELAKFSLNPDDQHRAEPLIEEALDGARRVGDPELLVWCLAAQLYVLWAPGNADQRIETADQIISRASYGEPAGAVGFARNARVLSLLEKGDLDGFSAGVDELERIATKTRDVKAIPFVQRYRATRAMLQGHFDEAERLSQEALAQATEQGVGAIAAMNSAVLTFTLRQHQGRLAELEPLFASMAADDPGFVGWTGALCVLYVELDRPDDVRRVFDSIKDGAPELVRDPNWLSHMTCFAEACVYLEDREKAQVFYDLLAPYAGCYVVVGNGDSALGSVARPLGQLATLLGRWEDAEGLFETAVAEEGRLGARPNLALAQLSYARMLLERGDPGDRERAVGLLDDAERLMSEMGMARGLERAVDLRGRLESLPRTAGAVATSVAIPAAQRDVERRGVFVEEGDYWTVGIDGHRSRLKASKGLQQIARLLREPHREFHVLDLAGQLTTTETSDVGRHLDERSYREYAGRLEDLRDGIAEARENNDPTRVAALEEELEFISREIAKNVGIGGRARRTGTPAERARVNVTRTIAKAISKIAAVEPALARSLERTVRTGTFCVYEPDPDSPVRWTL